MNANLKYEIIAGAFLIHTGAMAPGKDAPCHGNFFTLAHRQTLWDRFLRDYSPVIEAVLKSVEMNAPQILE